MSKNSIKVLTYANIAIVGGGEIIDVLSDLSNSGPIFSTMDKGILMGTPMDFSTGVKYDIMIEPCKLGPIEPPVGNTTLVTNN